MALPPMEPRDRGVYYLGNLDPDGRIWIYAVREDGTMIPPRPAKPDGFRATCDDLWDQIGGRRQEAA